MNNIERYSKQIENKRYSFLLVFLAIISQSMLPFSDWSYWKEKSNFHLGLGMHTHETEQSKGTKRTKLHVKWETWGIPF